MKTFIALSAEADYVVEKRDDSIYISFKPLKGKLVNNGYAKLMMHYVWDKGTKYEQSVPTLDYLNVAPSKRGRGVGEKLFLAILDYLKRQKIPYLIFDDYSGGFWETMKEKYPKSVFFPKRHSGRIGYIGTKSKFPI